MATVCTFKCYTVAANGVTTEKSGTISLNDVLVRTDNFPNATKQLTISANTAANPSEVTTETHGLTSLDHVFIEGSNSVPVINGDQAATVTAATTFTVAVNVATTAGTAGKATRTMATALANLQPVIFVGASAAATAGIDSGWYNKIASATFMKMVS